MAELISVEQGHPRIRVKPKVTLLPSRAERYRPSLMGRHPVYRPERRGPGVRLKSPENNAVRARVE